MDLKDITISPVIRGLLYANGASDSQHNIPMYEGWQEVAKLGGYEPYRQTPARNAYEEGYFSVPAKKE